MTPLFIILGILALVCIFAVQNNRREREEEKRQMERESRNRESRDPLRPAYVGEEPMHSVDEQFMKPSAEMTPFEYLCMTLEALGCQPKLNKERDYVDFMYQGEAFAATGDTRIITLWDLPWARCVRDENLATLMEAINCANGQSSATVLLKKVPREKDTFHLYSRATMMVKTDDADLANYLRYTLDEFRRIKDTLGEEFLRLKQIRPTNLN